MLESLPLLTSFRELVAPLRSCFPRQKTFENFVAIAFGLLMALGRGRLSDVLLSGGLVDRKHWSAFYNFFSRSPWSLDDLGLGIARLVLDRLVGPGTVVLAGDDTLHEKGGQHVFGAGMHHDALSSTRKTARFQFGHCWVVLSIVVRLPFATRPRALPILFRLNVPPKMGVRWKLVHRKKTDQLADLVDLVAAAFPDRHFRLVVDSAYSNKTVLRRLPPNMDMVGRLPLNAELHGPLQPRPKGKRGRSRKWGPRLATPKETAEATDIWCLVTADIYGRQVPIRTRTRRVWWSSAGPDRPLKAVTVWRPRGQWPYEAFFSTETDLSTESILGAYAQRWPIEVAFHETRDSLGVHRGQPRTTKAVQRTAPTGMLLYTLTVIWYAEHGHDSHQATWKRRPWYRHKTCTSFADMVSTFRRQTLDGTIAAKAGRGPPSMNTAAALEAWFRESA